MVRSPMNLDAMRTTWWPNKAWSIWISVVDANDGESKNVVVLETLFSEMARVVGGKAPNVGGKWRESGKRWLYGLASPAANRAAQLTVEEAKVAMLARSSIIQLNSRYWHGM